MHIPEEERHLLTDKQLRIKIRTLLGGRAAEHVFIGEITTGAHDDLKRASEIIRRMISEFGMSQSLGLVSLGLQNQMYQGNPFIKNEYAPVSEKLSQAIDEESRKILEDEFKEACKILSENRPLVERMTKVLLEKETIEYDEITAFFEDSKKSTEVALSLNP